MRVPEKKEAKAIADRDRKQLCTVIAGTKNVGNSERNHVRIITRRKTTLVMIKPWRCRSDGGRSAVFSWGRGARRSAESAMDKWTGRRQENARDTRYPAESSFRGAARPQSRCSQVLLGRSPAIFLRDRQKVRNFC